MHVSASVDIVPRHRGTYIRGGGGGGYVLSGHCSGQQISVKNEGVLIFGGVLIFLLFTGFYGIATLQLLLHVLLCDFFPLKCICSVISLSLSLSLRLAKHLMLS